MVIKGHYCILRPVSLQKRDNYALNEFSLKWQVDDKQVSLQCKVGSGSFGTVYRADYFGLVAIKKLNVQEPTASQLQAFKNEVCGRAEFNKRTGLIFANEIFASSKIIIELMMKIS